MSRRPANAIELARQRAGLTLGELVDQVPPGEGPNPSDYLIPLPTVARGAPAPYRLPLPSIDPGALWNPPEPSDSGAIDYNARQAAQLDDVPSGAKAEPITVYPAWESRLEGMRDFLAVLEPNPNYVAQVPTPGPMFFTSFEVPQGFTCFWKQFRFFMEPVAASVTQLNTLVTLLVDDTTVPHYFNLPLGNMAAFMNTFVIAAEGRRLTIRIDFADIGGPFDTTIFVPRVLLYGNLRPRTGEDEKRDVGMRPPPPVVVVPPPPPPPAPPPAAPRPNPFLDRTPQQMPGTPARAFHHADRDGRNPRGRR